MSMRCCLVWAIVEVISGFLSMYSSKIVGIGSYLPRNVVTNVMLSRGLDTSDEWIQRRTGIKQRHVAMDDETVSSMAYQAAIKALSSAGLRASSLDMIIFATTTPELTFPSCAALLHGLLECESCTSAFDIQAVCSGFVYAFVVAEQFIKSGIVNCVLVIGAEKMSKIVDWSDRSTCILFGDGAGAVILSASRERGVISSSLRTDGADVEILRTTGGASSNGIVGKITMDGSVVFMRAVLNLVEVINTVLKGAEMLVDELDWLVLHQANLRIIQAVATRLGIDINKFIITVDLHANTSSASIPLALDEAVRSGKIVRGDVVVMAAVGGGMTWGAILLEY